MGLKGNKQINETRAGLCRSTELVTSQKSTMNYPEVYKKGKGGGDDDFWVSERDTHLAAG